MVKNIRRKVMCDVEMILSRVKETMDREDIRKLSILPIHYPRTIWYEEFGIGIEGCDYSAGGVQLEQLKEIIEDVLDYYVDEEDMDKYIDEVLDNLWRIQNDNDFNG